MARKFIFEIDNDVLRLNDPRVDALRKGFIHESDIIRMIKPEDPFQMMNGRLRYITKEEREQQLRHFVTNHQKMLMTTGGMNFILLRDHKAAFLKVYPEVETMYKDIEAEIEKEQCKDCALPAKYQRIFNFITSLPKDRSLEDVEPIMPPLAVKVLKGQEITKEDLDKHTNAPIFITKVDIPFIDEKDISVADMDPTLDMVSRRACWDCVKKHLSEALVLMPECLMGYGSDKYENKWELIGHLSQAAKECVKVSPELADRIRSFRLKVMSQKPPETVNA